MFHSGHQGRGPFGPATWDAGGSRKHLLDAIDASLRRLGTDYVDLYQLHYDDTTTPLDETLEALDTIVRAGKARYIGVSNFWPTVWLARWVVPKRAGWPGSCRCSHATTCSSARSSASFCPWPLKKVWALSNPLAGGLLTGKYKPKSEPLPDTRFTIVSAAASYQDRYWHDREFTTVEVLRSAVSKEGHSLATVAVAWVLANPVVTSAIIGADQPPEQLVDTLAAVDFKLEAPLKEQLDDLSLEYRYGDAKR